MLKRDDITTYADAHPGFWGALARRLVDRYNQEAVLILKVPADTLQRHHYRLGFLHGLQWIIDEAENMGREAERSASNEREGE